MASKLYKLALWYIEKCNNKWSKHSYGEKLKSLHRLTYWNFGKYMLTYGADAEWRIFSRYEVLDNAIQKLAKYENYEEQGLLLRLPCKVGDTIYRFWYVCDTPYRIQEQTIKTLSQVVAIMEDGSFGKSVFLTREEADKALAELNR